MGLKPGEFVYLQSNSLPTAKHAAKLSDYVVDLQDDLQVSGIMVGRYQLYVKTPIGQKMVPFGFVTCAANNLTDLCKLGFLC